MTYRMAIEASVVLSVKAESEAEAREKTLKIVDENWEGVNVRSLAGDAEDFRLYFPDKPQIDVEDIEEPSDIEEP